MYIISNSGLYTEAVNHEYSNQVKNAKNSGSRQAGQGMSENQLSFETIHHLGFYYNTLKKVRGGKKVEDHNNQLIDWWREISPQVRKLNFLHIKNCP